MLINEISKEEFAQKVHKEASEWRHQKIKEVFAKENPTEMELNIINLWISHYGNYI